MITQPATTKRMKKIDHKKITFLSLWKINGIECLAIFSWSMMNHTVKFGPIVVLGLLKRINDKIF